MTLSLLWPVTCDVQDRAKQEFIKAQSKITQSEVRPPHQENNKQRRTKLTIVSGRLTPAKRAFSVPLCLLRRWCCSWRRRCRSEPSSWTPSVTRTGASTHSYSRLRPVHTRPLTLLLSSRATSTILPFVH